MCLVQAVIISSCPNTDFTDIPIGFEGQITQIPAVLFTARISITYVSLVALNRYMEWNRVDGKQNISNLVNYILPHMLLLVNVFSSLPKHSKKKKASRQETWKPYIYWCARDESNVRPAV